ncbi:hypothetical protein RRG08_057932 [Elysia crispata]|uniref:Uncharacterized protein n=1 Tax=Elysia crispata TaxID=231223 RepID=A0AAE0Y657_9GAST|nr:hypothetical protein RRG08_057932 [Elysia crispata]
MKKTESNSQVHIKCHAQNRPSSSHQNNSANLSQRTAPVSFSQNTQEVDTACPSNTSNSQVPTAGEKLIMAAKTGDLSALDRLLQQQQGGSEHFISQAHLNVSLLEVCRQGRKFIVQKLVRSGAEVNVRGYKRCTTPLHIAVEQGFVDIAAFLLSRGADVNARDRHENSVLILAVNRAGSSDMLNLLLAYKAKVNHKNSQGVTALMKAVEVMDIDAVKILILAGSNLEQKNKFGKTARCIAVKLGIADVFDSLHKARDQPLCYSSHPECALYKAALNNQVEAVKILLDCRYLQPNVQREDLRVSKANQNIKKDTLRNLIQSICSDAKDNKDLDGAKLELVKILLGSGIDDERAKRSYNCPNKKLLSSALIDATESGVIELVELLCKLKNIEINFIINGSSALMRAAEIGRLDIVKLLLNFGADPRKEIYGGEMALTYALKNGHIRCADVLLQNHKPSKQKLQEMAKVAVQEKQLESLELLASHCNIDEFSQSLMEEGILTGDSRIVQFLIDHGADINGTCGTSCPALLIALQIGRSYYNSPLRRNDSDLRDMIKFLVESGASVNRVHPNKSPLIVAIENNCNLDVLLSLLKHGADVNEIGDDEGNTPLTAVFARYSTRFSNINPSFEKALLKAGADPNKGHSDRKTAFHPSRCMFIGGLEIIERLIDAGADLEARNSDGMTPLLLAAREQQPEVIKLLKKYGVNMKAVDNDGKNAVFQTFERGHGHHETLQLVADKDQVNMQMPDGLTPLILAAKKHDENAIEIFLKAGADPHKKNNNQETALSILLDRYFHRLEFMAGLKMLIRHGALLSLPKYGCVNLYRMIICNERKLVQLMVTHGMAPMCVDYTGLKNSLSMEGISDSVWRNLSPLAAALVGNRKIIARYLVANWFLTPVDLVGSDQLKNLKVGLQGKCTSEVETFLDEYMSQPMSLVQLSFVAVSAQLGETIGREERVRKTPLPTILQDSSPPQLNEFRSEVSSPPQLNEFRSEVSSPPQLNEFRSEVETGAARRLDEAVLCMAT